MYPWNPVPESIQLTGFRRGLVIGSSTPGPPRYGRSSALAFAQALADGYGWYPGSLRVLTDPPCAGDAGPTKDVLEMELRALGAAAQPGDLIVLYFCGTVMTMAETVASQAEAEGGGGAGQEEGAAAGGTAEIGRAHV